MATRFRVHPRNPCNFNIHPYLDALVPILDIGYSDRICDSVCSHDIRLNSSLPLIILKCQLYVNNN